MSRSEALAEQNGYTKKKRRLGIPKSSNICISVVLGPISMKIGQFMKVDNKMENTCWTELKVIEVKGQISVFP